MYNEGWTAYMQGKSYDLNMSSAWCFGWNMAKQFHLGY